LLLEARDCGFTLQSNRTQNKTLFIVKASILFGEREQRFAVMLLSNLKPHFL